MKEDISSVINKYVNDVINKGDLNIIDTIIGNDFVDPASANQNVRGPKAFKELVKAFRETFSEMHLHIDKMVIDNNTIAWSYSMKAIHSGPFMGIKATGKPVQVKGIIIDEIIEGRINK